jgi:hypothetical protein
MKKMVLGLSLSLAALAFLMSPALAAESPPQAAPVLSVADQAFLASLARVPAGTPAPEQAAKRPHIAQKDMCTANCYGGGTVSCSGTGTCTAVDDNCNVGEQGHVVCNGAYTWCPTACPGCGPYWCNGESDCAANCSNLGCDYDYTCYDYPSCSDHCRCTRCVY